MGIYIKGMEMPTNCYGCLFFKQVDYWNKNDEADILSKCKRTGEFTWESVNGYLPNCPLAAVPPHGDLIDRDKFRRTMFIGEQCLYSWDEIEDAIDYAPTIIPAEEEHEENA